MKVKCYVRRTKLWAEEYRHSDEWLHKWRADQAGQIWNETFTTPYTAFRRRLHELQEDNLREVAFDAVVNQYEYVEDDSIVIPTDDDDWFHPDVIEVVKSHAQPAMYWNFLNYTEGAVRFQNPANEYMEYIYESNNYALIRPGDELLLRDHTHAHQKLTGLHIDANLSIHNRSLASLSVLKSVLESDKPHTKLLEMYEVCRRVNVDPNTPSYFLKYVFRMVKIYNDLKVRKLL